MSGYTIYELIYPSQAHGLNDVDTAFPVGI